VRAHLKADVESSIYANTCVLQCVCCSVLQCVAEFERVLQCARLEATSGIYANRCVLQPGYCSLLQYAAVH